MCDLRKSYLSTALEKLTITGHRRQNERLDSTVRVAMSMFKSKFEGPVGFAIPDHAVSS